MFRDALVDAKRHMNHVVDSLDILLYVCLLIMTIVTMWVLRQKRIRVLHESGLAVVYGLVVGLVLRILDNNNAFFNRYVASNDSLHTIADGNSTSIVVPAQVEARKQAEEEIRERATFNPELFFYVLLPPIIFHAGYSMRKKHFFDNLGAILAYALLGTTISTFVIALIMYGVSALLVSSVEVQFLDALYFGAVISATDPVTTLAIFQVTENIAYKDTLYYKKDKETLLSYFIVGLIPPGSEC